MNSNPLLPTKGLAAWLVLAGLAAFLMGCSRSKEPTKGAEEQPVKEGAVWSPTGEEGTIAGKVNFEGQPPKLRPISMDADAVCAAKTTGQVFPETVVTNSNRTLRNVFVYVKSGVEGKTFSVPESPVVLDQNGCLYKPHVVGIQARQNLRVVSSDNTTHNIHPMPTVNQEWNLSQSPGADAIVKVFSRPEVSIPVKCNQHPWMRAYIHVMSHPFFAVTSELGTFELKGLPPGNYVVEAVHEQYGAMTQQVKVDSKQTASLDFTYRAAQAYHPSSLETMPALMLSCCGKE